jgi:6-phosphogluconolactonase
VSRISRRSVLKSLPVAALAARHLLAEQHTIRPKRVLFGTGGKAAKGIYTAAWNENTGEMGEITLAAEVTSPSFLATCPRAEGHFVFAVSEASGQNAKLTAYTTVEGETALRKLNDVSSDGDGPVHLSISKNGKTVVCANYGGGSVSSFQVKVDGSLSEAVSHFQFSGHSTYKGRQEKPHTHSANITPDGKWVLVSDLGLDRIFIYRLNQQTAEMTTADPAYWEAKAGTGPRHIAFHPKRKWLYSVNELISTVDIFDWNSKQGTLTLKGSVSTLKEGFPADTAFAGEIVCSLDGRQVYVGNRVADNTIAVFDVDSHTGMLKLAQLADNAGKNPRHIALSPSNRWLVIADVETGSIEALARDAATGRLSESRHTYRLNGVEFTGFI